MNRTAPLISAWVVGLALTPTPSRAEEVVVFAAASLKTALDAVAAEFEATTGHTVTVSYAGSNQLAMQIIAGAPADIFLSAAVNWMDEVEGAGLTAPGTRADLFGNTLVLVGGPDAGPVDLVPGVDLAGLLGDGKLAMALVDSVPAGQYGKAALDTLGAWEAVAPEVAQADNVRAALAFVALGEAPYGIVYGSDAVAEPGVQVVGTFPADNHPPIVYPGALLTGAADAADSAFLAALTENAADAVFAAQGFVVLP
ncbi:molybdate transport system substrate-binding protein [Loktanella fryxellensis]|uniref:Molybdate-binding protein ModA n=1 Tax=Loktanella fryxellensis TaxID=245187 RepID=A0A1H8ENK1_9RHOB|nr:molybdate ABC transporter substrate-binding protein [Loktanella fryxellensis]SEN21053.1 molybdate transport system substrate-binding protein [Loktanella fryxellensis]